MEGKHEGVWHSHYGTRTGQFARQEHIAGSSRDEYESKYGQEILEGRRTGRSAERNETLF
jgi:hypothetical protein